MRENRNKFYKRKKFSDYGDETDEYMDILSKASDEKFVAGFKNNATKAQLLFLYNSGAA